MNYDFMEVSLACSDAEAMAAFFVRMFDGQVIFKGSMAGEPFVRMVACGITFVFRKLAIATELARQGTSLSAALKQAGVFPRDVSPATRYLRRIGRPRAEKIYSWLLEADTAMKGGSRLPERIQLETLLVRLGGAI